MENKFYLTSTLPYVNADPHIGHTLEFIQADVIVRYFRKKLGKENVWFNTGADEHGLKIYQKAIENNKTPQEYVDFYSDKWKEFCELFFISYDTFYRTSSKSHHKLAQEFWKKSSANGDIYKKKYEGLYCVGCEEFKTDKDLVSRKCPLHNVEPIFVSEENYFFKLSKYREELLSWLDSDASVLEPKTKFEELRNWIKNMEHISISRVKEKLPWGIEVPGDPSQVMYVWFDALTNYINVFLNSETPDNDEKLKEWWPGVQIFGPDNLRFQGAIWQAMLSSAGLPHTKKLLCHGMILAVDGTKMSKSIGNVVSPFEQFEKYGAEAIRFYLISAINTFNDSPYKEDDLINNYNAHLANNYGNLLNRVIHLSNKAEVEINNFDLVDKDFKDQVDSFRDEIDTLFESYQLQLAANKISELASFGNEYITINKPWEIKDDSNKVQIVLNNLSYLLATVNDLYEPIIPSTTEKAKAALANREPIVLFPKLEVVKGK